MKKIFIFLWGALLLFSLAHAIKIDWQKEQQKEQQIFGKFINLEHPRAESGIYIEKLLEKGPYLLDYEKIATLKDQLHPLVAELYRRASNKKETMDTLIKIFKSCRDDQKKEDTLRAACDGVLRYHIGEQYISSEIIFLEILSTLQKEKNGTTRGIQFSNFDENYPLLDHPYMRVSSEYALGDYLFGIANSPTSTWVFSFPSFDGIVVLKAWDTHRQEFARIYDPQFPERNYHYDRMMKIEDGKIVLSVYTDHPSIISDWDTFLVYTFILQQDTTRKLSECWEAEKIAGENQEIKKADLSLCKGGITVTTTL